jgi:O-antigen/teichoic acid export membrane protein
MGRITYLVNAKETVKTATVKTNIIANFSGKAWTSIMSLIFIPVYIKFMGIEAYGLIGIFVSLMALLSILDMGLSATLSRELARLSVSEESAQESKDLVRTLEVVYWSVGFVVGLAIMTLAPIIAHYWIKAQGIPAKTIEHALVIMGLIVALQWPTSLYDGGLIGLQRQVLLNSVRSAMATIQHGGAVFILWFVSPTILSYFAWQIFISMVQTFVLAYSVRKALPITRRKSIFQINLLKKNWRFAAGMMSISITATILTQADKILLSKLLTLALFGYYVLAFNLANATVLLVTPVFSALFPKLSQLISAKGNETLVSEYYHKGCQLVSITVFPVAGVLAFFSLQVLQLWVRDPVIAQNSHSLLSLLTIGSTLNSIMTVPFTLQLASGWTKLSFFKNVIAVIVLVPSLIWLVSRYGAIGAAFVWIILNTGYFLIEIPIMHRRLLKLEMWRWYFQDIGIPLLMIISFVFCSRLFMPHFASAYTTLIWILLTGFFAVLFSTLTVPFTREWLKRSIIL